MPISRLNYTGRKRISRKDVRVIVHALPGQAPTFDADLRIGDYRLPDEALVFVEAYRQTLWMRFPFGKVGAVVPPADRRLSEFESPEGILFRVRVTSASDKQGVMLAEADHVPVKRAEEVEEDRLPLLPVQPADLGDQIWKVDFSGDPVLQINKSVGDWRAVASSPVFRSLVCPAVFRDVLGRALDDYPDLDDREDWRTRWLLLGRSMPGVADIPEEDEKDKFEEWAETVVESFARQQTMLNLFLGHWHVEVTR